MDESQEAKSKTNALEAFVAHRTKVEGASLMSVSRIMLMTLSALFTDRFHRTDVSNSTFCFPQPSQKSPTSEIIRNG